MPRRSNVDRYPVLKWFASAARKRPYLWSFKVPQVSPALYVGSVIAFLPLMGVQIVLGFGAALLLRANLPIMVGLQGISNPFTIPFLYPIYFFIGKNLMEFLGIGRDLNPIMSPLHATFLGGAIVGLMAGAVLDLLYRGGARGVKTAAEHHRKSDDRAKKAESRVPKAGKGTSKEREGTRPEMARAVVERKTE